jgi:transcriptional regulator with XRE-family HTH domain
VISSGIKQLDRISGGFKAGDNVVWQVKDAAPVEYFLKAYFNQPHEFNSRVIYINFNYSPHTVCRKYPEIFSMKNVTLIDAFTNGKGRGDEVFLEFYTSGLYPDVEKILIDNPADQASFSKALNTVQASNKSGSFYVFDSLTGMMELWKNENSVLDFFAFTCPKLFDLDTIAYWVLESDAHSREFLAGISHITQVIFNLDEAGNGEFRIRVNKLDRRESSRAGGVNNFRIIGDTIAFNDKRAEPSKVIGETLRDLRKGMNITQSDLADRLSLTSGALSQIENGLISPSLNTLISIAEYFSKPVEFFITGTSPEKFDRGYEVIREGSPVPVKIKGITMRKISEQPSGGISCYIVNVDPGAGSGSPLLYHKGGEIIYVIDGALEIISGSEKIIIKSGESLMLTSAFIDSFRAAGSGGSVYMHILF